MALSKLKKMLVDDIEEDDDEMDSKKSKNVTKLSTNPSTNGKMILLEPRAYSESQQIADHLKKRNTVVVNMKRVTADQAKRIVDFLSGTIYAIGGDLQKLGGGIFLLTPSSVSVEGKISDESQKGKDQKRETKLNKDDEEKNDDEFNW